MTLRSQESRERVREAAKLVLSAMASHGGGGSSAREMMSSGRWDEAVAMLAECRGDALAADERRALLEAAAGDAVIARWIAESRSAVLAAGAGSSDASSSDADGQVDVVGGDRVGQRLTWRIGVGIWAAAACAAVCLLVWRVADPPGAGLLVDAGWRGGSGGVVDDGGEVGGGGGLRPLDAQDGPDYWSRVEAARASGVESGDGWRDGLLVGVGGLAVAGSPVIGWLAWRRWGGGRGRWAAG